jgi:peptidyl-dipeptidase A
MLSIFSLYLLSFFFTRYHENNNNLNRIYSTAKVPSYQNPEKLLSLEPDLTEIFATSRDAKELEYYWKEWRNATGVRMREDFIENIDLINEAAR